MIDTLYNVPVKLFGLTGGFMSAADSKLERKVEYGVLSSFYAPLLTERQRSMLDLYCNEDFSLAEAAKQLGVTRQCVNDTLQRAFAKLDELEEALHLAARFERQRQVVADCRELIRRSLSETGDCEPLRLAAKRLDDYLHEEET